MNHVLQTETPHGIIYSDTRISGTIRATAIAVLQFHNLKLVTVNTKSSLIGVVRFAAQRVQRRRGERYKTQTGHTVTLGTAPARGVYRRH